MGYTMPGLKFMVHVLLKPALENFEHYFTSMWDECNCVVVWAFFGVAFLWDLMTSGKTIHLTRQTFVGKVISLIFNILVIAFFPRIKHHFISWLQSPYAVILEPKKIKSLTVSIVFPSICPEVMQLDAMILVFWTMIFKPTFSCSSFTFIKRLYSSLLSAIRVVSSAYLR